MSVKASTDEFAEANALDGRMFLVLAPVYSVPEWEMDTRIKSQSTPHGYQISIASKKIRAMLILLPVWLAGWTLGGILAFWQLMHADAEIPAIAMSLWLVAWAAGELGASYLWLWSAFGKEILTVSNGNLVLKTDILGHGKSKVFPVSQITNLRASGLFGSFHNWSGMAKFYGLSGGVIVFESEGRTFRFGKLLEEDEAQQVVYELANHLR